MSTHTQQATLHIGGGRRQDGTADLRNQQVQERPSWGGTFFPDNPAADLSGIQEEPVVIQLPGGIAERISIQNVEIGSDNRARVHFTGTGPAPF